MVLLPIKQQQWQIIGMKIIPPTPWRGSLAEAGSVALIMAACGRAVALLLLAAGASAARGRDTPPEPLLAALIRLQATLDDIPSCEFKTKGLWTDIEKRQQRLEKLQEGIFQKMNDIARIEMEYPSATECQDPFQWMSGGCYYHSGRERATWGEARFACGRMGADLAHPADNWSLKDYTRQISSSGYGYYFIGGRADNSSGFRDWHWVDGRPVAIEHRMYSQPPGLGECLVIDGAGTHSMKAKSCDAYKRWYICELKVRSA
ncbi:C-type lectin domain family 4 member G-like [Penaeus monodon]|uniref:C-type lectin domain family 4 member G-like n=1 Tax=Penaeus monodon TaxID=6687 RepID=UPI0018A733BE|nr:C-type lectin domain family 4 member G-like [Penaeus monodon]